MPTTRQAATATNAGRLLSLKATTSMHPAFLGGVWDQLFGHPKTPPDPRLQPIHGDEIDDLVNQQLAHGDNR